MMLDDGEVREVLIADTYVDDVLIKAQDGNETIEQIISCISGKGYSVNAAAYLLEQAKQELYARIMV